MTNLLSDRRSTRPGKSPVFIVILLSMLLCYHCSPPSQDLDELDLDAIDEQVMVMEASIQAIQFELKLGPGDVERVMPRSIDENGMMVLVPPGDWTSGFYPGILWYMYELTGYNSWKELALEYTSKLENQMYNASNHDVGFRMYCSYGNALRITGDTSFIPILVQSAETLITRYNKKVGCIRSWDFNTDVWEYPVIIDNMMNLELLFWASEQTGNPVYREIAIRHANTTLENHFRPDYSSFHVVDYDTITGAVRGKYTHQGFNPGSAWARGQSWGLYGFTMVYRYTKDPRYLEQAEGIARFLLNNPNLPKDQVPYWDYDAPRLRREPKDASAAAIMASALYELGDYLDDGGYYRDRADWIMESLSSTEYRSPKGENYGFILNHSTGGLPQKSEIDVPIIYADYYYLEALLRRMNKR